MSKDTIEKIYAEVPEVHCKGLCTLACGPVLASPAEQARIVARCGSMPEPLHGSLTCSKLIDGRCSIYADRPLICRVWGTTRRLRCQWGCSPEGGFLPERQARKLLLRADKLPPTGQS